MNTVRAVFLVTLTVTLGLFGFASSATAKGGGGNKTRAKACQKGGYQNLYTSDGERFESQDACVAYAAAGGTFAPTAGAEFCYNATDPDGQATFTAYPDHPDYATGELWSCQISGASYEGNPFNACSSDALAAGASGVLIRIFYVYDPVTGQTLERTILCVGPS